MTTLQRRRRRYAALARWGSSPLVQAWRRLLARRHRTDAPGRGEGGPAGGTSGVREPRRPAPAAPPTAAEAPR